MQIRMIYEGLNIRGCVDTNNQEYLYTIQDTLTKPPSLTGKDSEYPSMGKMSGEGSGGFYVYDLQRLCEGKIERYKLEPAIGGQCNLINSSRFGDRFAFIQSLDQIVVMPFPHLNLIRCVGMGHKL